MSTLALGLLALDMLAALRGDEIVSSVVSPRVSVDSVAAQEAAWDRMRDLEAHLQREIDAYADGSPVTLRSAALTGKVSQ